MNFYPVHLPVVLEFDSLYAAQTTQSLLRVNSNASLIISARSAYAREASRVVWKKVAAQTGRLLNERADVLAKVGARHILRSGQGSPDWALGS